jgi:hypothetical protein
VSVWAEDCLQPAQLARAGCGPFFARLTEPVHVASWIDDLIFIMSTQDHGECACFELCALSILGAPSRSRSCGIQMSTSSTFCSH